MNSGWIRLLCNTSVLGIVLTPKEDNGPFRSSVNCTDWLWAGIGVSLCDLCALGASVGGILGHISNTESQSPQSCTELLATHGLISFEEHSSAGLVIQPSSSGWDRKDAERRKDKPESDLIILQGGFVRQRSQP